MVFSVNGISGLPHASRLSTKGRVGINWLLIANKASRACKDGACRLSVREAHRFAVGLR